MGTKFEKITEGHSVFLRDESRKTGCAETISFPESTGEVIDIISKISNKNEPATIQGARTGITGGAVPGGGHIINLSQMNRVTGIRYYEDKACFILKVQSGIELLKLRRMIEQKEFETDGWDEASLKAFESFRSSGRWFFPPDPTETSASIGGMAACNASGAQSFYYGPTRNYIESIEIVFADGSHTVLRRGIDKAEGNSFKINCSNSPNRAEAYIISGELPDYSMPDVKNASGYYSLPGMDLADLFIGSEGTLGIITGLELRLVPLPVVIWGVTSFFAKESDALSFVREIRKDKSNIPVAIEFFNGNALKLLRKMKNENPAFKKLLNIPENADTAIYTEYHGSSSEELFRKAEAAAAVLESCGGDAGQTWVAHDHTRMEQLHFFRHAVPEAVNLTIDARRKSVPGLTKLGTDMAVPDNALEQVMEMYNSELAASGLESVIFGHIGKNHVHVNIIPRSMAEYAKGKDMYQTWAKRVIALGGTVSAEHGIGKMKTALLREMYGSRGIDEMLRVREIFDPKGILNQGNLFEMNKGLC